MELTQEELDARIAAARDTAVAEKESALRAEIEKATAEAKKRVEEVERNAQKKVSEQGTELGELRRFKTEAEPKLSELTTAMGKLKDLEEKLKAATEKAPEPPKPDDVLDSMTDDEAKAVDTLLADPHCPPEIVAKASKPETRAEALAEAVMALREHATQTRQPSGLSPAAQYLAEKRARQTANPASVRQVLRDILKQNTRQGTRMPVNLGGRQAAVREEEPAKPSAQVFTGRMRDYAAQPA